MTPSFDYWVEQLSIPNKLDNYIRNFTTGAGMFNILERVFRGMSPAKGPDDLFWCNFGHIYRQCSFLLFRYCKFLPLSL